MLLMSCRKAAQMLSATLEGDITIPQRFGLRLHLLFCRNCSRLREQLLFLRRAGFYLRTHLRRDKTALLQALDPESREGIEKALERQALKPRSYRTEE